MELIIVESPTKAKTLSKFLGKGYSVVATKGHIKDLPKSPISVDIENNFEPDYKLIDRQKDTISSLKKEAKSAKNIYLATDPDREGEAIAAHVKELINGKTQAAKKIERIEFHEITKEAVEHAINHPRKVNENLVDAQVARRVLDRIVGYKLSPVLWKKVRRGLSAGRVQSVALRLIAEREQEIEAFKPDEYWIIVSEVAKDKEKFEITLSKINGKKAEIDNEKDAKSTVSDLEKASYKVAQVTKKEVQSRPYAPFTTSTMTQSAARLFGWSAKKTMRVAQILYEEGHITYHRTDSVTLSKTAVNAAEKYIKSEYGDSYYPAKQRFYKSKSKNAQEAHEAIRPTNISNGTHEKSADTKKLYQLIWKRFISSQMASAVYDRTTVVVNATKGKNIYELRATGSIMKFDGWKKVYNVKESTDDTILPDVSEKDDLALNKVISEQKFTQPPPRYNEASLIKTLEELGIGRPSTYAPIISTLIFRKYIERVERAFKPTPVGMATNEFLVENFKGVMDYEFTANMEEDLDKVARGEIKWQSRIEDFWKPFEKTIDDVTENAKRVKIPVEKLGKKCPDCKEGELVIRIGRFGKFISCSTFPECKYTEKYLEKIDMKCPDCKEGEVIVKKTGKGRPFYGCSRYPECDFASWKDPRTPLRQGSGGASKNTESEKS